MGLARLVMLMICGLAAGWYFLSGGSEFEPGPHGVSVFADVPEQVESEVLVHQASAVVVQPAVAVDASVGEIVPVSATNPNLDAESKARLAALFEQEASDSALKDVSFQFVSAEKSNGLLSDAEYRVVTGSRVNMRRGPSTGHDVVGKLIKGAEVEVLDVNETGWVKLRTLDGSKIGWMSDKFLAASN